LKIYSALFAPITPLITQEVWDYSPRWITENTKNPLVKGISSDLNKYRNEELELKFKTIWKIKDKAKLIIEKGRQLKDIKSSLEADIYITVPPDGKIRSLLSEFEGELEDIFMTSHFKINSSLPTENSYVYSDSLEVEGEVLELAVVPSSEAKCPRCWKFTSQSETDLCHRCDGVVGH
jgi:isoleucyl-tRNA synthetase